jgi:hypothetical protein
LHAATGEFQRIHLAELTSECIWSTVQSAKEEISPRKSMCVRWDTHQLPLSRWRRSAAAAPYASISATGLTSPLPSTGRGFPSMPAVGSPREQDDTNRETPPHLHRCVLQKGRSREFSRTLPPHNIIRRYATTDSSAPADK